MKSWLSLTAAALLAASLAPAALADGEGLVMFGSVAANSTGDNIILDIGGRPLEAGSRVELRQTYVRVSGNRTNLHCYVPFVSDDPDAPDIARFNPTILSFPIGTGDIDRSPGVFSVHLSSTNYNVGDYRIQNGSNYFVVVFDPTETYFRMSTNFCVRSGSTGINHYPKFRSWAAIADQEPGSTQPVYLDTTDSDGDGLTDQFEAEIGTDPANPDTDGDGFSDQFEYVHYMDPLSKYQPDFRLTTEYISEGALEGTLYDLTWNAGVDLKYSVEYSTALPSGEQSGVWSNILTTNATANFVIYNVNEFIENPDGSPTGFFRLWYQTDEEDENAGD